MCCQHQHASNAKLTGWDSKTLQTALTSSSVINILTLLGVLQLKEITADFLVLKADFWHCKDFSCLLKWDVQILLVITMCIEASL